MVIFQNFFILAILICAYTKNYGNFSKQKFPLSNLNQINLHDRISRIFWNLKKTDDREWTFF